MKTIATALLDSRGLNIHSENSNFDMGYITVQDLKKYLTVHNRKINYFTRNKGDDIYFDLRHFLNMVQKSNITAFQFLNALDLTKSNHEEILYLHSIRRRIFNTRRITHQYAQILTAYYKRWEEDRTIKYASHVLYLVAILENILTKQALPGYLKINDIVISDSLIQSKYVFDLVEFRKGLEQLTTEQLSEELNFLYKSIFEIYDIYFDKLPVTTELEPDLDNLFQYVITSK